MPIIMVAAGVVPSLLVTRPDTETKVIGIIDQSGAIEKPLSQVLSEHFRLPNGQPNYVVRPLAAGPSIDLGASEQRSRFVGAGRRARRVSGGGTVCISPIPRLTTVTEHRQHQDQRTAHRHPPGYHRGKEAAVEGT